MAERKPCPECGEKYLNLAAHMVAHKNKKPKDEYYYNVVKPKMQAKARAEDKGLFFISPLAKLKINQEKANEFVPTFGDYQGNNELMEQVGVAINSYMPVLFIGDTGTGKTSLVRYLAKQTNHGFRRVNHNGATTTDDILGKILVDEKGTYWVDGVLIDAMRNGYWYLADEINAAPADVNFLYHSLLDDDGFIVLPENKGEVIRPHENFRFFGAMNPSEYAGTKEVNKALLSRFAVFKTDYVSPVIEAKIIQERTGVAKEIANAIVKFAGELRLSKSGSNIDFTISTRDLLMWGHMHTIFGKYIPAAEMSVLNKVNDADYTAVKDLLGMHFKTIDEAGANKPEKAEAKIEPDADGVPF